MKKDAKKATPNFKGLPARLIPTVSPGAVERRAVSILLSALISVEAFRRVMLQSIGRRVGDRTHVSALTEVVFLGDRPLLEQEDNGRPDGALVLRTGQKEWKALIEAKTDSDDLKEKQVSQYVDYAKKYGFDAVITISNQFVAMPDHHPVAIDRRRLQKLELYHWSWTFLLTQAQVLLESDDIDNPDQRYILQEVVAYFNSPKSGVKGFTQMNTEWTELAQRCRRDSKLKASSPEVQNTVASWHQEQRELCLQLWTKVKARAETKLPRAHRQNPGQRLNDDCDLLVKEKCLRTQIVVPDAAAPLDVKADLCSKVITCQMTLTAPQDKKSTQARVNWLLRQIPEASSGVDVPFDIWVRAKAPGRSADGSPVRLAILRKEPLLIYPKDQQETPAPAYFEIWMESTNHRAFTGRSKFIEELEQIVPSFYEHVGQHLKAWVAPPPKMRANAEESSEEDAV